MSPAHWSILLAILSAVNVVFYVGSGHKAYMNAAAAVFAGLCAIIVLLI